MNTAGTWKTREEKGGVVKEIEERKEAGDKEGGVGQDSDDVRAANANGSKGVIRGYKFKEGTVFRNEKMIVGHSH